MSGMGDKNRETPGVEAPGPIDRALDRDRDDRIDIMEGDKGRQGRGTAASGKRGEMVEGKDREVRVPVVEEQLTVGKREVEQGSVDVRKTVTEEQQSVPVTLRQEEVTVQERDTKDRPLRAGEEAFQEGTIRVPVRGEEAVVAKEAVVTGEVVIDKRQTSEERTVTDTVRKERVEVDENYNRARGDLEQYHKQSAKSGRTFEQAEPQYRAGYTAAYDTRYQGRQFEEVEPDLRREYETNAKGKAGGDSWEQLRQEVREGWRKARS